MNPVALHTIHVVLNRICIAHEGGNLLFSVTVNLVA